MSTEKSLERLRKISKVNLYGTSCTPFEDMPEIPEFEVTGSSELNSDFDELGLGSGLREY